jgi:hypothetical protein
VSRTEIVHAWTRGDLIEPISNISLIRPSALSRMRMADFRHRIESMKSTTEQKMNKGFSTGQIKSRDLFFLKRKVRPVKVVTKYNLKYGREWEG